MVESVYGYVFEKRRFAAATGGTIRICFTHITPIIDKSVVLINVPIVVAEPSGTAGIGSDCAVGGSLSSIGLTGIFVVVTEIVVPHGANQITTIIMQGTLNWLVIYFLLYDSFSIVLIHHFSFNIKLGQLNIFDQQSHSALLAGGKNISQCRNCCGVYVEVHMKKKLEPRSIFVPIGTKCLGCVSVIFEIVVPKECFEEILPKGHSRIIL